MEDKILEIKEVKKSYRKREVLHNTNFVLKTGEIYIVVQLSRQKSEIFIVN